MLDPPVVLAIIELSRPKMVIQCPGIESSKLTDARGRAV
jgi:hypothetical protein